MPKPTNKSKKQPAPRPAARKAPKALAPLPEPVKKPAPNKAKPPRPAKKQDVLDIDRADSEGMAQPQEQKPQKKIVAAPVKPIAKKGPKKR
ncbi:MAG: hypothetical protein K8T25_16115 [Planctomycetia bacterium]|nr:hypothetical protein [Planctomycetia bacterium]